jgi:hypothetical protein
MRKGKNPAKLDSHKMIEQDCYHHIIVPVHLPKLKGYYSEGLDILKLTIESLALTIHRKTFITIVNNGSCPEVKTYLDKLLKDKKIHEVIHTSAIGKINAIAKGLSGHKFDLVTISDADVLFTNGWQKAVYDIYNTFPKAGVVCTTPQSKRLKHFTESIFFDNMFNPQLKFRQVKSSEALKRFAHSIGNKNLFHQVHLEKILSLTKENVTAVMGAGHFTATYRPELIDHLKSSWSRDKISPKSDKILIDQPTVKYGHWRLSTYDNYTFHLGNHYEDWMTRKLSEIKKSDEDIIELRLNKFRKYNFAQLKIILVRKLLFNNFIWKKYLKKLGLNPYEAENY